MWPYLLLKATPAPTGNSASYSVRHRCTIAIGWVHSHPWLLKTERAMCCQVVPSGAQHFVGHGRHVERLEASDSETDAALNVDAADGDNEPASEDEDVDGTNNAAAVHPSLAAGQHGRRAGASGRRREAVHPGRAEGESSISQEYVAGGLDESTRGSIRTSELERLDGAPLVPGASAFAREDAEQGTGEWPLGDLGPSRVGASFLSALGEGCLELNKSIALRQKSLSEPLHSLGSGGVLSSMN